MARRMLDNNHKTKINNLNIMQKERSRPVLNLLKSFENSYAQRDGITVMKEQLNLGNSRFLQLVLPNTVFTVLGITGVS